MKYYLLKFEGNWADEMDLDGAYVMDEKEYTEFKSNLKKLKEIMEDSQGFSFGVGTNEDIEYRNFEQLKRAYTIKELILEERDTLKRLKLDNMGFAEDFISRIEDFIEDYWEEEDEDEDN